MSLLVKSFALFKRLEDSLVVILVVLELTTTSATSTKTHLASCLPGVWVATMLKLTVWWSVMSPVKISIVLGACKISLISPLTIINIKIGLLAKTLLVIFLILILLTISVLGTSIKVGLVILIFFSAFELMITLTLIKRLLKFCLIAVFPLLRMLFHFSMSGVSSESSLSRSG